MIHLKSNRKTATCLLSFENKKGDITIDFNPINTLVNFNEINQLLNEFKLVNKNIKIITKGGGFMSKAIACKLALAKLILKLNPSAKQNLVKIDSKILRTDTRRKLPKKYGCYGARAKRQKSYR